MARFLFKLKEPMPFICQKFLQDEYSFNGPVGENQEVEIYDSRIAENFRRLLVDCLHDANITIDGVKIPLRQPIA